MKFDFGDLEEVGGDLGLGKLRSGFEDHKGIGGEAAGDLDSETIKGLGFASRIAI